MSIPDAYRTIPVFEQLKKEREQALAYEAFLALYVICAPLHTVEPPQEALAARTLEDILGRTADEEFLTQDRDPQTFGGVTILAALRAAIESDIRVRKAKQHERVAQAEQRAKKVRRRTQAKRLETR